MICFPLPNLYLMHACLLHRLLLEQERKVKTSLYQAVVLGSMITGNKVDLSKLQDHSAFIGVLGRNAYKSARTENALKKLAAVSAFRKQVYETFTTRLDLDKQRVMLLSLEQKVEECRKLGLEKDYPSLGKEFTISVALSRNLKAQIEVIDKISEAIETANLPNLKKYIQIVRLVGRGGREQVS